MKVQLLGGPKDMDGTIVEVAGGRYIICPVKYETASYIGECDGQRCRLWKSGDDDVPEKHDPHPMYKDIYNRKYEIIPEFEPSTIPGHPHQLVKIVAWYRGEE